jgi:FkbH-like protein
MKTPDFTSVTDSMTIAITATFTAESLKSPLRFWMDELGFSARIEFAPYNQVFQQILDPASLLSTNTNGINVVLIRLDDWMGTGAGEAGQSETSAAQEEIRRNVQDLVHALRASREGSSASFLLCFCPASPLLTSDPEWAAFFKQTEKRFASDVAGIAGIHVVTTEELASKYNVPAFFDPQAYKLARIPFTPVFFTALGTMIARKVYALKSPPYKVIVLDCDQTLWAGVCGEDGPLGVMLDTPHQALQQFMLRQYEAGMLLCLCSKNNEEDVAAVFDFRPEMTLKREHFVAWRINWNSKSENLKSLAQELNLGLDSFILIDDNPVECAEVEAGVPEVLVLQLPRDADKITNFLRHFWAFDHLKIAPEDRQRTAFYQQNVAREAFRGLVMTFEEFLNGLRLNIDFATMEPSDTARASDLILRTNQFNTMATRRSEADLQRLCRQGDPRGFVVRVRDRFGDYGIVGLTLFQAVGDRLVTDTFLLSCRAMGRGVEHRMLAKLGETATERGLKFVEVPVTVTPKNQPALVFLDSIQDADKKSSVSGFIYRFPAKVAAALQFRPSIVVKANGNVPRSKTRANETLRSSLDARPKAALLASIASELQEPEEIHKVISAQNRGRDERLTAGVPPQTSMEKNIAKLWSDILGFKEVGRNENFFALGGHSLLAMQVLSSLYDAFHVELSPRLLYTGEFTVAGLTKAVLAEQARQSDPKNINAILTEIATLTDEEVTDLLKSTDIPKRE